MIREIEDENEVLKLKFGHPYILEQYDYIIGPENYLQISEYANVRKKYFFNLICYL